MAFRVIEKHWKECHQRPWREFRRPKWYEIKWLVYLARWTRTKVVMKVRFPFVRTRVDFSSGEPLVAFGKDGIICQAAWMEGGL